MGCRLSRDAAGIPRRVPIVTELESRFHAFRYGSARRELDGADIAPSIAYAAGPAERDSDPGRAEQAVRYT
jgi:hypothetical protein